MRWEEFTFLPSSICWSWDCPARCVPALHWGLHHQPPRFSALHAWTGSHQHTGFLSLLPADSRYGASQTLPSHDWVPHHKSLVTYHLFLWRIPTGHWWVRCLTSGRSSCPMAPAHPTGFQKVLDSQVTWAHRWDSCLRAAAQPVGLEKLLAWPRMTTRLPPVP